MKVYIVFGSSYESWAWDRVYKDKEKAEERAKELNKLPTFEEAQKIAHKNNYEKDAVDIQEEAAQKLGQDRWACDHKFGVSEFEVIE